MLDGARYDGFADRDDLPEPLRNKLARWALQLRPEDASDEQRARVEQQQAHIPTRERRSALQRAELLSSPVIRTLWRTLSENEQALVLHPEAHLSTKPNYPLAAGGLAKLVDIDIQQVRRWSNAHLLPSTRDRNGHRQFGAAAVIIAFALRGSKQNDREYYTDIARSSDPLAAMRRALALITYSAFAGEATAHAGQVASDLEGMSKSMHDMAAALSEAARAIVEPQVSRIAHDGDFHVELHKLGAMVRLAEAVPDETLTA